MSGTQTALAVGRVRLQLCGPFRVESPDGTDMTPVSARSCAILAMLATAPGLRRGRFWIQNRLWSDRGPQQASGSLRQAFLDIRRALGRYGGILVTTRVTAQLLADSIEIKAPPARGGAEETSFLQGLDIRDLAFRDWLQEMRLLRAVSAPGVEGSLHFVRAMPVADPVRPTVILEVASETPTQAGHFSNVLHDWIARSIADIADVDVIRGPLPVEQYLLLPRGALLAQMQIVEMPGNRIWIRAGLEDLASTSIRWSGSLKLTAAMAELDDNHQVLALVHQLVFAVVDVLSRLEPGVESGQYYQAAIMAAAAFRRMFKLQHHELDVAGSLLDRAIAMAPRGLYHALRAQLSTIRLIERQSDPNELPERCEADIVAALAIEPMNSGVLACVANARLNFSKDIESSLILSRQSVRANRSNPLAWWSLANASLYAGDHETAYAAAVSAQLLADASPLKAWADFQRSLTAFVRGQVAEGLTFAQSAHAFSPGFRPPLRYLIAIQASAGSRDASRDAARKLKSLEADFSIERMMSDPDYPASMLRRSHLVNSETFKGIEV
jgi:hypothetical protein